ARPGLPESGARRPAWSTACPPARGRARRAPSGQTFRVCPGCLCLSTSCNLIVAESDGSEPYPHLGPVVNIYVDSANQTLHNGSSNAARRVVEERVAMSAQSVKEP